MSIDLFHALAGSLLGTLGFAMLVHAPRRSWLPGALIGMAAFLIYWLLGLAGLPEAAAIFIGSLTGAMAALFCARWLRMISTVFLMMSIVAFVPGLGLYQCMHYLGEGETVQGAQAGAPPPGTLIRPSAAYRFAVNRRIFFASHGETLARSARMR